MDGSSDQNPSGSIPTVPFSLYDADFDAFSRALGASFERYGFAVVAGHGLPADRIDAALASAKALFALPEATKRAYVVEGGAGQRGYTPFGVETAKGQAHHDLKAFWHVGRDLPAGHAYSAVIGANVWPTEVEGFREHATGLYAGLEALGLKVLRAIARHLGLADDAFEPWVKDSDSILRLLHYPPLPADQTAGPSLRAGPHEDINAITLLLGAEEAGLELLTREGQWLAVNPPPGSVVINIGDMLQRLTNNRLPSTTHRVVNPAAPRRNAARYSTPFFLHFAPDFRIETLAGCIDAERPDRYPQAITAREFLLQRLREIKLA